MRIQSRLVDNGHGLWYGDGMRKTLASVLIILGSLLMVSAAAADQPTVEHVKVTICHRTHSDGNPYVQITVDDDAVDGVSAHGPADHYGEHQGPIWSEGLKPLHIEWGDIIPPVDGFHDGLNWTEEGQLIYGRGCAMVVNPSTTTTTENDGSTTTTSSTVPETSTTTTSTVPESSTTTVDQETTSTTATVGTVDTVTKVTPTAPDDGTVEGPATARRLPATGMDPMVMAGAGLVLLTVGAGLTVRYRR